MSCPVVILWERPACDVPSTWHGCTHVRKDKQSPRSIGCLQAINGELFQGHWPVGDLEVCDKKDSSLEIPASTKILPVNALHLSHVPLQAQISSMVKYWSDNAKVEIRLFGCVGSRYTYQYLLSTRVLETTLHR